MKVRKTFKFEMAHVLTTSYSKECQKCHGHSYKLEIVVGSVASNSDGMVIDFKKLKEIVMEFIISKLDHRLVIEKPLGWAGPGNGNLAMKLPWLKDLVTVNYNPTAENMVADFYHTLYPVIKRECPKMNYLKVRLHETESGWAETEGGV